MRFRIKVVVSFFMEASGCPLLCKEDHGCLSLSWETSCFRKKLADNPAALLQASASGQIPCILFSSLYPYRLEQTKTSPETRPQSHWGWQGLWKWAALNPGQRENLPVPTPGAVSGGHSWGYRAALLPLVAPGRSCLWVCISTNPHCTAGTATSPARALCCGPAVSPHWVRGPVGCTCPG